jgi:hypothetical protein
MKIIIIIIQYFVLRIHKIYNTGIKKILNEIVEGPDNKFHKSNQSLVNYH